MPRTNKGRTIGAEDRVRAVMREERERRGWSYETMAAKMTDAGCSIVGSAIYKMEKGDPPRRVRGRTGHHVAVVEHPDSSTGGVTPRDEAGQPATQAV